MVLEIYHLLRKETSYWSGPLFWTLHVLGRWWGEYWFLLVAPDLEKQDRLWSEPFGAGYNAGGECEAVFSVREGCEAVFSVHEKRWCKRVGYEYWHIWLHMTRWYIWLGFYKGPVQRWIFFIKGIVNKEILIFFVGWQGCLAQSFYPFFYGGRIHKVAEYGFTTEPKGGPKSSLQFNAST